VVAWIRERGGTGMSRRSVNPGRRMTDGGLPTVGGLLHPKSRSPPVLTIALVVLVPSLFCISRHTQLLLMLLLDARLCFADAGAGVLCS
jgi:hypothetical protein